MVTDDSDTRFLLVKVTLKRPTDARRPKIDKRWKTSELDEFHWESEATSTALLTLLTYM